jgi:hypothetical protein
VPVGMAVALYADNRTIGEAIEITKQPGVPLVAAERERVVGGHGCWCCESFACNAEREI